MAEPPRRRRRDVILVTAAWGAALAIALPFAWLLVDLTWRALPHVSWSFLVEPTASAGRAGGIAPILLSTSWILAICLATTVPVGLGTAILLAENVDAQGPFGRLVRRGLDVLAGVPSIVFGLFGNALFCVALGMGFSILAGGLTLACMALPLFIRASEEGLRAVPRDIRHGAAALGLSRTCTLVHLLLPAATPALIVGLVLAIGRALAETAALLFTSGYVDRAPDSLLDSGRTLSVHIYDLSMNVAGGNANAYATALVLVALLLATNLVANRAGRLLGGGKVR